MSLNQVLAQSAALINDVDIGKCIKLPSLSLHDCERGGQTCIIACNNHTVPYSDSLSYNSPLTEYTVYWLTKLFK